MIGRNMMMLSNPQAMAKKAFKDLGRSMSKGLNI